MATPEAAKNFKLFFCGYTLLELIVVIAIIGVLAGIAIVAVNPARQLAQANNTERRLHMSGILTAIYHYIGDHQGAVPESLPQTLTEISKSGADMCEEFVPDYMFALPVDPSTGTTGITESLCATNYHTGYMISYNPETRDITISAPDAELGEDVVLTR